MERPHDADLVRRRVEQAGQPGTRPQHHQRDRQGRPEKEQAGVPPVLHMGRRGAEGLVHRARPEPDRPLEGRRIRRVAVSHLVDGGGPERARSHEVADPGGQPDQRLRHHDHGRGRQVEPGPGPLRDLPERQCFGAARLQRPVAQVVAREALGDGPGEVVRMDRLEALVAPADRGRHEGNAGEPADRRRAAVASRGVDEGGTKQDPWKRARPQVVLRHLLGDRVLGARGGVGAHRRDMHQPPDPGRLARGEQGDRGRGMDRPRRLPVPGLEDAGAVHHRIDPRQQRQPVPCGGHVVQVDPHSLDAGEPAPGAGGVAYGRDDDVAFAQQAGRHGPPDEPRRSQEQDPHRRPVSSDRTPPGIVGTTRRCGTGMGCLRTRTEIAHPRFQEKRCTRLKQPRGAIDRGIDANHVVPMP